MKQLFYFLSVGLLMVTAFARMSHAQTMMIGVRGGVNLANQSWSNLGYGESVSIEDGLLAGGQVDFNYNNTWALSIQILYDQKGAHGEINVPADGPAGYSGTADWTASYIEIPILAKASSGHGAVRPYFFAGPSIGFLLSNKEKTYGSTYFPNGVGVYNPDGTTVDITDSTAKIDFSIVAGVGVSANLDSGIELFLDAAFAYGLINTDNYNSDKANGLSIYSRDIRLAAGILFPLN